MNVKILLKDKFSYKWISSGGVNFCGYFFNGDERYDGENAINLLSRIESYSAFTKFIKGLNGLFSIIIEKNGKVWAAVDRARSMPIYYSTSCDGIIISDSPKLIRDSLGLGEDDIDGIMLTEYVASGYVVGNNTVFKSIKQLDIAQSCLIQGKDISNEYYYHHLSGVNNSDINLLSNEFTKVVKSAFGRIISAINGRPIVISLSSGYDSRFVACMLKELGAKDVSCYTYGGKDSFEVVKSKEVAEKLGYRWRFVEYDKQMAETILASEYWNYTEVYDYSIYLQNFYAVYSLQKEGWFKKDSVFLTGMCGDMPTGFYVPLKDDIKGPLSNSSVAMLMFNERFARFKIKNAAKKVFISEVENRLIAAGLKVNSYQSLVSGLDVVSTGYSHSRCFLHMNNVHEFFGYEWLLPLWDNELLNFLYSIPAEYRYKQHFYESWLMNNLFNKYNLNTKKVWMQYSGNEFLIKLFHFIGSIVAFILFRLNIPFKRKYDFNNFSGLELKLFKMIKEKSLISYMHSSIIMLLIYYCAEKYYGNEAIARARKYFK